MEDFGTPERFQPSALSGIERDVWAQIAPHRQSLLNVAYSGGLDSSVLLEMCASFATTFGLRVRALHVNHGWSPEADWWEQSCRREAKRLAVDFHSVRLNMAGNVNAQREEEARKQRYAWFRGQIAPPGLLVTAHHLDDQAETFLFRLMRGSSINGLAGMRPVSNIGGLNVLRPFLRCTRKAILDYAEEHGIHYCSDPTNSDTRFDRNFLRHRVLPEFEMRWPSAKTSLVRAAEGFHETQSLLDEVGAADLTECEHRDHGCHFFVLGAINRAALLRLSPARQRNLLRYWVRRQGQYSMSEKAMDEFLRQLAQGAESPTVQLSGTGLRLVIRVFREGVFLVPDADVEQGPRKLSTRAWDGSNLRLAGPDVELQSRPAVGKGVRRELFERNGLELRWAFGNIVVRPSEGSGRTRRLRILFQELGIPPWERERMPLIFSEGRFVGIPGVVIEQDYAVGPGAPGVLLEMKDLRHGNMIRQS